MTFSCTLNPEFWGTIERLDYLWVWQGELVDGQHVSLVRCEDLPKAPDGEYCFRWVNDLHLSGPSLVVQRWNFPITSLLALQLLQPGGQLSVLPLHPDVAQQIKSTFTWMSAELDTVFSTVTGKAFSQVSSGTPQATTWKLGDWVDIDHPNTLAWLLQHRFSWLLLDEGNPPSWTPQAAYLVRLRGKLSVQLGKHLLLDGDVAVCTGYRPSEFVQGAGMFDLHVPGKSESSKWVYPAGQLEVLTPRNPPRGYFAVDRYLQLFHLLAQQPHGFFRDYARSDR